MTSFVADMVRHRKRQIPREPGVGKASVPDEVRARVRFGFVTTQTLTGGAAVSVRVNDPVSYIPSWGARAADFLTYRVVQVHCTVSPDDSITANVPANPCSLLISVVQDSVVAPPIPGSAAAILEYAGSKIVPYNPANPLSTTHFHWACRDLNALLYGPTNTAPPARFVNLFVQLGQPGTGTPKCTITGWMDIEFKGLAPI